MKKLLAYFNVFPSFLDYLHSFGMRHHSAGEDLPTISLQPRTPTNEVFELCFDVRYPEANGRSRGDPWSIRHTALYCQYNRSKDTSTSILIQPSKRFEAQMMTLLRSKTVTGCRSTLIQHALLISSGGSWQEFIASLENELKVLVGRLHELNLERALTCAGRQSILFQSRYYS